MRNLRGILLFLVPAICLLPGCTRENTGSSVIEQNKNLENAFALRARIEKQEKGIQDLRNFENSEKQAEKSRMFEEGTPNK
ncbi:MAG: hypothetical protein WC335_04235 [Candidatus Omnitrophota bacterium]|jgi:hypothetical protein